MFQLFIRCNVFLLLPLLLAGFSMSFLCMHSEEKIRRIWGWSGIVLTGAIGTPIHECSHLLVALLFGYKIVDVKLFCPVSGKKTGVLGYVKYRYRKNFICKIGNFFVGIAPMIGGSLMIWILFRCLLPDTAMWLQERIASGMSGMETEWIDQVGNLIHTFSGKAVQTIIFVLLFIAISLHMSISKADLKGAAYGVVFLEIVLLVISVLISNIQWNGIYQAVDFVAGFLWMSLSTGLIAAFLSFLVVSLIPSR